MTVDAALIERIDQMERDIEKIAQFILVNAVRDEIELHGDWDVWAADLSYSQFSDDVAARHEIQVCNVEMHDNIEVDFEMLGSLADVFRRHKFSSTMHAVIQNSGNESVKFEDEHDIAHDLDPPSVPVYAKRSLEHMEKLSGLHKELNERYLFAMVSQ
jgi:hypothetical protein